MKITIKVKDNIQYQQVKDNILNLANSHVEYGFFQEDDLRPDGLSNIQIAKTNYYGDNNIPSRDMFKQVVMFNLPSMLNLLKQNIKKNLKSANSGNIVMTNLASFVDNCITESFTTKGYGTWKPNAPFTVRRKGFNHPLVETGELYRAMKAKVISQ